MKNKKILPILLICIGLTMIFFTYQVVITFDTSHYLWLTSLLTKDGDFSTWDIARGPIFPLFIRISNILFGQSPVGILVGMFIFYIVMLAFCYLIYKDTIKDEKYSKILKWILGILFIILVVVNPMIMGYYHTLLTEFVAITFAIIGCYLAYKWIQIDFVKQYKIKYSIYTISLAILTAIAWQLKQPYVGTILFPVIIAAIISFVRNVNLKNFIQRIITIIICVIALLSSIKIWNAILENNNVDMKKDRTSSGFFATGILKGLSEYRVEDAERFDTIDKININERFSNEDKEELSKVLSKNSDYKSYTIIDINEEKYKVIYSKDMVISTGEAVNFLLDSLGKRPQSVFNSYISNYLSTISVYPIEFEGMRILVNKEIDMVNTAEIGIIGYKIYEYGNDTVFPLSVQYEPYATPYRNSNTPIVATNYIMRNLQIPVAVIMKISYLLLPLLTLISIVAVFITKKKYDEKYCKIINMITILFTFSLMHILVHSTLGSTIDRYTMPALATTFIGLLLSIYAIIYRKKYKINK